MFHNCLYIKEQFVHCIRYQKITPNIDMTGVIKKTKI